MKHRHETEIKLAVRDAKELRRRLAELGFRAVLARHFESNYLFDFPDQLPHSPALCRRTGSADLQGRAIALAGLQDPPGD
jgi:adenylate cyclase class IV